MAGGKNGFSTMFLPLKKHKHGEFLQNEVTLF